MPNIQLIDWVKANILKIQNEIITDEMYPWLNSDTKGNLNWTKEQKALRDKIEPWLTALFQSEHLSLLAGTGLTLGVNEIATITAPSMVEPKGLNCFKNEISKNAKDGAIKTKRGTPNCEDYFRVALEIITGLNVIEDARANTLENELREEFSKFYNNVVISEELLQKGLLNGEAQKTEAFLYLKSFLLSFCARAASRERLNVFTTNYERFIEYALDDAGVLWLDRFTGKLKPVFRNIRLELDYHYNPPGIRGEPRYVEGVVRLIKLHGSIDWERNENREIIRKPWPFGEAPKIVNGKTEPTTDKNIEQNSLANAYNPLDKVIIYPNASKDMETVLYPYAELFRDFATSICRPNSVVVTYGYGFGDDHINRILKDMLTIPSTHLCVISFDKASGRIQNFLNDINIAQYTLLIGNHFGDLRKLVDNYLPKPAIDKITSRLAEIRETRNRGKFNTVNNGETGEITDE